MSKAEDIEHLVHMARNSAYHAYSSCMDDSYGYLDRLQKVADAGGYITDQTMEAMGMEKAADELRRLAFHFTTIRAQLLANYQKTNIVKLAGGSHGV